MVNQYTGGLEIKETQYEKLDVKLPSDQYVLNKYIVCIITAKITRNTRVNKQTNISLEKPGKVI